MKLIFATHNQGKIKEARAILRGLNIEIISAEEAGIFDDVQEDGKTFEENALKKARFVAEKLNPPQSPFKKGGSKGGFWAIADDSGICVEALGCFPGIHSARWLGENIRSEDLAKGILQKMENVPEAKRVAYFQCVIALVAPDNRFWIFDGRVNGSIATQLRGESHPQLPYDPIFIPKGHNSSSQISQGKIWEGKTFAEMTAEEKNNISHRAAALGKLKEFFEKMK